ncbi:hypothetical protein PVAP13_3KG196400, partial [Panicum virgatum]
FFFFGSSTANAGEENGTPGNDSRTKHTNTLETGDEGTGSSGSCSTRLSRSRSHRQKRNKDEPGNPKQLRRSMSFSSTARNSCLDERCFSFSGDVPCSLYDESDAPQHPKDAIPNMWSPERNPIWREYAIQIPKEHSTIENDSPCSRCSCSAGHSPVSSPIALRCRPTRIDTWIHEDATVNEKQKQYSSATSMVSNLGRPPRPQPTVPSIPKSTKNTTESYLDVDLKDVWLRQIAQEGTGDTCKITVMCNASRNHISMSDAFERESATSVEDIYEDLQDVRPPSVNCPSTSSTSGEEETDDRLLQRAKEVESRFIVPCGEEYEFSMLRDKRMSSNDMLQLIQQLTEDRKQLAHELSSQIKARVAERFSAKEQYKQSKKELDTRTRRLEKENSEIQTTLEREMDRRSHDWSLLAEQNVSFQREVTFLEANKAEASTKAASLEMQNSKLNDDLDKLRMEHEKLQNSSVDLHARFAEVVEERDHIRKYLKDKEGENKALHKVIARLQTTCNKLERTITGLRQGCTDELDKKFVELTGVEQKLRGEIQSCHLEVKSLRQENITLLNRMQGAGNGASFCSIRLDQELQARVTSLQMQGLSLLDKISQLCTKLLDLIKQKKHENELLMLTVSDYTFEYQSIKGGIESLKQSLKTINYVLSEKLNVQQKSGEIAGSCPSREQMDDFEHKLKEETMLSKVLKEAVLSKELDIEQLEAGLASSLRLQDVMRNEIQRVQDELSCITHETKQLELQVSKKDEAMNEIQQDFQESAKELTALRGTLKTVTEERDLSWQEAKQLRRNISIKQIMVSLKKKIEALDEDILLKEGQITILQDSIEKQFDIICSPRSMRESDME